MFLKNWVSATDLALTKAHRKQIFWNLGWFQAGPHLKVAKLTVKTKIDRLDPEP